jgi:hypothetical protein
VTKISLIAALMGAMFACVTTHAQTGQASPVCTDRPTKANATCTVPVGDWQVETDVANMTHARQDGVVTDTLYPVNPYLKYGLGPNSDIEINWAPSVRIRSKEDGRRHTVSGSGDVVLRFKSRIYSSERVTVAVIPFIKAPTARRGIGNDRWEGGLAVPIGVTLPAGFSLTLGPEVDLLADADGRGNHLSVTNLVNVSHPLTSRLSLAVEFWQQNNRDPGGRVKQQSADMALVFSVTPAFQVDVGANTGVNAATPDYQVYAGMAYRW